MITEFKLALFLGFSPALVNFYLFSSTLCSAHCHQTYFQPNNFLPANLGSNQSRLLIAPRQPFKRAIIDFVVSCLFLGIPYIFHERTRLSSRIIDEESGLRYATPTLVIGLSCGKFITFLLSKNRPSLSSFRKAAVVLTASVTFLSLPGLDSFSRTTGMVAILFAAFSKAATVVAIFKHKTDLERPICFFDFFKTRISNHIFFM